MGALLSNGTADITGNILAQLRKKHPPRNNPIVHPGPYPGWFQLTEDTNLYSEKDPNPDFEATMVCKESEIRQPGNPSPRRLAEEEPE